jgi:hypothetical protein
MPSKDAIIDESILPCDTVGNTDRVCCHHVGSDNKVPYKLYTYGTANEGYSG